MTATQTQQPTFQKVTYDVADSVATITLNDPASLNALNSVMKGELYQALDYAEYDDTAKVIVLTGAGKAFKRWRYPRDVQAQPKPAKIAKNGT